MEGEKESVYKKLSLPKLDIEYHEDRIVVRMLTEDAMEGIDPGDDLMFLADIYEDWKNGPVWLDETGKECTEHRWTIDSDTGWVHYFNDVWTRKQRDAIFVDYVLKCFGYDNPPIVFHPSERILCLKEDCIMLGEKILLGVDPLADDDYKAEKYKEYVKKVIRGSLKQKE